MTETPKLNLRQKLVEVYKRVDHVEKAGYNEKQRYGFVRAADVLRAIRNAFADLGIYAETNYDLLGVYDIKTNSGGVMHTATVKATIKLYDTESDETKTISGLGDGADGGDKGVYKAMTGATKNALRNGTLLPDEADPEADESVDNATSGQYRAQNDPPDFQDARHAAPNPLPTPRAQKPAERAPAPQEAPLPSPPPPVPAVEPVYGLDAATVQATTAPEHGDAWEGPDSPMPTEEELTAYRTKFKNLGDDLSANGKLTASKGLPITRKLLVFLLHITKATDATIITKAQWEDFFDRVERAKALETGLVGLGKLVNKINGIEKK